MTNHPRRTTATLLAATALAVPLAATAPTAAYADTQCEINGFSPTTVEVGLSPKAVTFSPKVTGCDLQLWSIEGGDFSFFVFESAPKEVFQPYENSQAGSKDVVVTAYNADYEEEIRVFDDAFRLKRNTTWDKFNAAPEPVRKGATITIKGRLRVADWTNDEYDGYANRNVDVEFKTRTGSYKKVKTVTSGAGGYVSTTVTASADGTWRLRYGGNSTAGGGTTAGDFVDVR